MRRLSASLAEWNVVLKVIVIKLVFDEVFHNTPFYIDMKMIMRNIFFVNSFTMPTDNNMNFGFPPCFWLILRYAHGLYGKVLSRSRALSYSKNTTENLFTTENAEISDDFWKRRTRLYFSYYKRAFFIKALKYRRFGNVHIIICWHPKNTTEKPYKTRYSSGKIFSYSLNSRFFNDIMI